MTINRISSNDRLSGAVTFKDLVFLSGQVPGEGLDVGRQILPARGPDDGGHHQELQCLDQLLLRKQTAQPRQRACLIC